jgi:hypothetical protein
MRDGSRDGMTRMVGKFERLYATVCFFLYYEVLTFFSQEYVQPSKAML